MILIGATTENPYFEVNSALLSCERASMSSTCSEPRMSGACSTVGCARRMRDRGAVAPEALDFLAERSGGDARTALNALELACEAAGAGEPMTLAHAEDALQRRALLYDRQADRHYDTISAWIKATRGSDPDASLYYLAVMLEGGEDPRFIVRRMVVLASEDIGNADPPGADRRDVGGCRGRARRHARGTVRTRASGDLPVAGAESDAAKRAVFASRGYIREHGAAVSAGLPALVDPHDGGYDNPHRRPGHFSPQELLPDAAVGARFYEPDDAEAALREKLEQIRLARRRDRPRPPPCLHRSLFPPARARPRTQGSAPARALGDRVAIRALLDKIGGVASGSNPRGWCAPTRATSS